MKVIDYNGNSSGDDYLTVMPVEGNTDRLKPRQVGIGVMRGQQTFVHTDGSKMVMGVLPGTDNQFGLAFYDTSGRLVAKHIGPTRYIYDHDNGSVNVMQDGKLPVGYGFATAKNGKNVSEIYS